jgi:hypothetical protein
MYSSAQGTIRRQMPQRPPTTRMPWLPPCFPTDGSQDGCEGQRGQFGDRLWSWQRREDIAMMNNEQQGTGSHRPCKAEVIGSMASVSLLVLSIPILREAT